MLFYSTLAKLSGNRLWFRQPYIKRFLSFMGCERAVRSYIWTFWNAPLSLARWLAKMKMAPPCATILKMTTALTTYHQKIYSKTTSVFVLLIIKQSVTHTMWLRTDPRLNNRFIFFLFSQERKCNFQWKFEFLGSEKKRL